MSFAEWSRKWVAWSRKKQCGPADRPPTLNNEQFLCEHGRLCLDLTREAEAAREITIVQPKEWAYLKKTCVCSALLGGSQLAHAQPCSYDAGPPINVWQDVDTVGPSSSPAVCSSCLAEK